MPVAFDIKRRVSPWAVTDLPASEQPAAAVAPRRIALYGNFGTQNIGNECTLQTVIENLHERLPHAAVYCICSEPETVSRDHSIPAVPLSMRPIHVPSGPLRQSRAARIARIVFRTLPLELRDLLRNWRQLRGTTDLMVIGTGVLEDDDTETRAWMLSFLRWCIAARLRGSRIVFLSIGAGPIPSRFARTITKAIFGLAKYVSYRDTRAKQYMESVGFDTTRHRVFPDVAFGLALTRAATPDPNPRSVGVGVVDASKFEDAQAYGAYLQKLSTFVLWLLERGFAVRMIHGDGLYDKEPLRDFVAVLRKRGIAESDARISVPEIDDVRDLLRVMGEVRFVVASRYHNIILSLALGKPAIGLSYHMKFDALMAEFGLGEYCRGVRTFEPDDVAECFATMVDRAAVIEAAIRAKTSELREQVDEQYRLVLAAGAAAA